LGAREDYKKQTEEFNQYAETAHGRKFAHYDQPKKILIGYDKKQKSVLVPKSINLIEDRAFKGCRLEYAKISDKISVYQSKELFAGCKYLKEVILPAAEIYSFARFGLHKGFFKGCVALEKVVIPACVTFIGESAFQNCKSLSSLELPYTVNEICKNAFKGCKNLKVLRVPAGCKIAKGAIPKTCSVEFYGLFQEEREKIDRDIEKRTGQIKPKPREKKKDFDFKLSTRNGKTTLTDYGEKLQKDVVIPDGVTKINPEVFNDCEIIESLVIPASVTEIGEGAFAGCKKLRKLTFLERQTYSDDAIKASDSLGETETQNKLVISHIAFADCKKLQEVVFSETLKTIDDYAFARCSSLTLVKFPNSLEKIGAGAFKGCKSLISIDFPDYSVRSIGESAFEKCSSLEYIRLNLGLKRIAAHAFDGVLAPNIELPPKGCTCDEFASNTAKITQKGKTLEELVRLRSIRSDNASEAFERREARNAAKHEKSPAEQLRDARNAPETFDNLLKLIRLEMKANNAYYAELAWKKAKSLKGVTLAQKKQADNVYNEALAEKQGRDMERIDRDFQALCEEERKKEAAIAKQQREEAERKRKIEEFANTKEVNRLAATETKKMWLASAEKCLSGRDFEGAARFFKACAECGNPDAMLTYSVLLDRGLGTEADAELADMWRRKASLFGVTALSPEHASILSPPRPVAASATPSAPQAAFSQSTVSAARQATAPRFEDSIDIVAILQNYEDGFVPETAREKKCRKSFFENIALALEGSRRSPVNWQFLGDDFRLGSGCVQNPLFAVKCYEKGEKNTIALRFLADAYYFGNGVSKDLKKAFKYYNNAFSRMLTDVNGDRLYVQEMMEKIIAEDPSFADGSGKERISIDEVVAEIKKRANEKFYKSDNVKIELEYEKVVKKFPKNLSYVPHVKIIISPIGDILYLAGSADSYHENQDRNRRRLERGGMSVEEVEEFNSNDDDLWTKDTIMDMNNEKFRLESAAKADAYARKADASQVFKDRIRPIVDDVWTEFKTKYDIVGNASAFEERLGKFGGTKYVQEQGEYLIKGYNIYWKHLV